jgi:hypothetical protein
MSLLEQLKQSLGPNALQQISEQLGTDHNTTNSAVSAALPVLLGALAQNASTPAGANALNTALANNHDGSALDNMSGTLSGAQDGAGASILSHVLGTRQDLVTTGIGAATGLDASRIGSLLTMLAPVVMGALGKARQTGGLDAGGLASMLGHERANIGNTNSELGGIMGLLDANHDGSVADDVLGLASKFLR